MSVESKSIETNEANAQTFGPFTISSSGTSSSSFATSSNCFTIGQNLSNKKRKFEEDVIPIKNNPYTKSSYTDLRIRSTKPENGEQTEFHVIKSIIAINSKVFHNIFTEEEICNDILLNYKSDDILAWLTTFHPVVGNNYVGKNIYQQNAEVFKLYFQYDMEHQFNGMCDYLCSVKEFKKEMIEAVFNTENTHNVREYITKLVGEGKIDVNLTGNIFQPILLNNYKKVIASRKTIGIMLDNFIVKLNDSKKLGNAYKQLAIQELIIDIRGQI
jgi:hypothetical protein